MVGVCSHAGLPPPELGPAPPPEAQSLPTGGLVSWSLLWGSPGSSSSVFHILLGKVSSCHSICVNRPVEKMRESLTAQVDAWSEKKGHSEACRRAVCPRTWPEARGLVLGSVRGIVLAPVQATRIMNGSTLKVNPKRRLSKNSLSSEINR